MWTQISRTNACATSACQKYAWDLNSRTVQTLEEGQTKGETIEVNYLYLYIPAQRLQQEAKRSKPQNSTATSPLQKAAAERGRRGRMDTSTTKRSSRSTRHCDRASRSRTGSWRTSTLLRGHRHPPPHHLRDNKRPTHTASTNTQSQHQQPYLPPHQQA